MILPLIYLGGEKIERAVHPDEMQWRLGGEKIERAVHPPLVFFSAWLMLLVNGVRSLQFRRDDLPDDRTPSSRHPSPRRGLGREERIGERGEEMG